MDRQNNEQTHQNQNQNQNQQQNQQQNQHQHHQHENGFTGFFFPLDFVFGGQPQTQTDNRPPTSPNPQQNGQQFPQIHFFIYPIQEGDNNNNHHHPTSPGVFFFTPFFMPQQEVNNKPRASESAIKKLPIVTITKEHVDKKLTCPICLDPFSLPIEGENKTETSVRQMPCNHLFCESCLFQWLRQNNTCPLCRKEIEAEKEELRQQQNNNNDDATSTPPNVPSHSHPPPSPTTPNVTTTNSCTLASIGCCEESDTPIITLPQCHHRFHTSCLRTSLLVEGYSPGDFNSIPHPLNFRCPTCRAPAIVQSDMLKTAVDEQQLQQQQQMQNLPFNLPITIHMPPNPDAMDID